MVPFFYVEGYIRHASEHSDKLTEVIGRERVQDLLPTLPNSLGLDVRHFVQKVNEQKEILKKQEDARVLTLACTNFTSLQHVQILRVQDSEDASLISYSRGHANHLVELRWPPGALSPH
jgi:hypothetical protein